MKTAEFLTNAQQLLGIRNGSKEWQEFSLFSTNEYIETWYKLAYRYYVACLGRAFSPNVVKNMLIVLVTGVFSSEAGMQNIAGKAWEQLNNLFAEDAALPRIQRFFPEFKRLHKKLKSPGIALYSIEQILSQVTGNTFQARLLQICSLIAGKEDPDLLVELDTLVSAMLRSSLMSQFEQTVRALYENKQAVELSYSILAALRDTANDISMIASLTALPEVPQTNLTLENPAIREIRNAIVKFSADSVLRAQLASLPANVKNSLGEMYDIFKDFGNSTIRKKYLRLFAQTVEAYT